MNACEYLARVGYEHLMVARNIERAPIDDDWADRDYAAAREAATLRDHGMVRAILCDPDLKPLPRSGDLVGAKWLMGVITWPDRVPGLKTWAGQSTLPRIIASHQRRLREAEAGVLYEVRGAYRTSKDEGPSGLDSLTCQDAIDVGFSPAKLGMDISCRPGLELLAIIGLESVPLVSFAPRVCGFVHDSQFWRFPVEERDGGYFFRWGQVSAVTMEPAVA